MDTIRGGIKEGYNQAMGTLSDIGALQFDGVQSGIDQTMKLVDEKLKAFETQWRKDNGVTTKDDSSSSKKSDDSTQTAQPGSVQTEA